MKSTQVSDTLEHQPTVWPVPYACEQPYHPGSGSHGQLFLPGRQLWCRPFQTVTRFLERIGLTRDRGACGVWSRVGKQFCGGGIDGFRDCGERLERFQKNSRSNWARVDSTYEKTLIELRTYVRALPLEELDGFSAWA